MFRFTIRDVLWLMVVVGMGATWCIQGVKHWAVIRSYDFLVEEIDSSGDWIDSNGRVLMITKDAQAFFKIVPYQKGEDGIYGPAATP